MKTYIRINSLDIGPEDLSASLPVTGEVLFKLGSTDGAEYLVAELNRPIHVNTKAGPKDVTHLVVAAHIVGESLTKPRQMEYGTKIAYVTDESLLKDSIIDFGKADYVAVGFSKVYIGKTEKSKPWWKFW